MQAEFIAGLVGALLGSLAISFVITRIVIKFTKNKLNLKSIYIRSALVIFGLCFAISIVLDSSLPNPINVLAYAIALAALYFWDSKKQKN